MQRRREIVELERVGTREGDGSLDHSFELPDIAGPVVDEEGVGSSGRELQVAHGAMPLEEVPRQLGDVFSPARLLGAALLVVGLGCGGLVVARGVPLAVASMVMLGLGYGAAYISVPVVFGYFFGRRAFAGTSGVRIAILAISGWLGPRWAGAAADTTGSYLGTFVVLTLLCVAGAAAILMCPRPGARPARAAVPSVAA